MTRRWIAIAAKATITGLLIWWLLDRIDIGPVLTRLAEIRPLWLLPIVAAYALQIVFAAERWRLVAQAIGVDIPRLEAARILMIGLFFNQTLPSAIGGDAVRVWLVSRAGIKLGKSVNFVLCDRVVALMVLLVIVGLTLPLFYALVGDRTARLGITVLVAGGAVGFGLALVAGDWFARLFHRFRLSRPLGALASDFRRAVLAPRTSPPMLLLSALVHLLTIVIALLVARALALQVEFAHCLVLVPPVVLLTMVPVSIAGWGLRESAMVVAFGFVGVAAADALAWAVAFGLAALIGAAPGGVLLILGRRDWAKMRNDVAGASQA